MTETLDGRTIEPFTSSAPNLATTVTARPYDLESVGRWEMCLLDPPATYRCWSFADQSMTMFVRADGQVTLTGEFVGDHDALVRLIDVLTDEVRPIAATPLGERS